MKPVKALSVAVASGMILVLAACNSSGTTSSSKGSSCGHDVAFFGALTGSSANLGLTIEQGVELAIDQYNSKHGSGCITLKKADSQGDPSVAPGLARQLVADPKLIGVIGPVFSGESTAAVPIFNQAGIPVLTEASSTTLTQNGWTVFHRVVGNDGSQGPAAGRWLKDVAKAKKVFVVDDQSTYGIGLSTGVKQVLGSLVVGTDKTAGDGKQTDFSSTVQRIVASGADALFYGGFYQNAGLLRRQLTQAGWKGVLIGGDGLKDSGYAKAAGSAAAAGTEVTCLCAPISHSSGTFLTNYRAMWHTDPGSYADVCFDATNMLLEGLDAGNTTPSKLNGYLDSTLYTGAAGTYKFTSVGELDPSYVKVWLYKFNARGEPASDGQAARG